MAPGDRGRVPVECGGAIGVFGVSGQTGEVDVLGFAQSTGRHRLSGIHDMREDTVAEKNRSEQWIRDMFPLAVKSDQVGPHVMQIGLGPILRLGKDSDGEYTHTTRCK